jgi:hypothetical protein
VVAEELESEQARSFKTRSSEKAVIGRAVEINGAVLGDKSVMTDYSSVGEVRNLPDQDGWLYRKVKMSAESPHPTKSLLTPNLQLPAPAKVLIRAPNWVGDAVMALPALRELRRIFAASKIIISARPWVQGIFDGERLADSLISVDDSHGLFGRAARFISEASGLRRERFDFAVLLTNSFGTALAARAGCVGLRATRPTEDPLLDQIPLRPG